MKPAPWSLALVLAACRPPAPAESALPPPGTTHETVSSGTTAPAPAPTASGTLPAGLTLVTLAQGAVLLQDLGRHRRAITTATPAAQRYFDQGLNLYFGGNPDEAARSFAEASLLDARCAMCFWGIAWSLGPYEGRPMAAERAATAREALAKAKAAATGASPVEQALIEALAARDEGAEKLATAMREVAKRFPEDLDAQVLAADALMEAGPAGADEVVKLLEPVLVRDERHPGANHAWAHAIEGSAHPERAVRAAERLAELMPGAGHLVHVSSHVFARVGRWGDAASANRRAIEVDGTTLRQARPIGDYALALVHDGRALAAAAAMQGRAVEALSASRAAARGAAGDELALAEPLLVLTRFGKWEAILAEPEPDAKHAVWRGLWQYARGMAFVATGKLEDASGALAAVQAAAADAPAGPGKPVLAVAEKALAARLAEKQKKPEALALWADAVKLEDELPRTDPPGWFVPLRHYAGAALLAAKRPKDAEAVFRQDLEKHPANGWALYGLTKALDAQKKKKDAAKARRALEAAWSEADTDLTAPAF